MEKRLTDEMRARIAQGWRRSGMSQPEYAAQHAVTDRTLRLWVARWAPSCPKGSKAVRDVCAQAMAGLQALMADLDLQADDVDLQGASPKDPPAPLTTGATTASSAPTGSERFSWT